MISAVDFLALNADIVTFKHNSLTWEFIYHLNDDWPKTIDLFRDSYPGLPFSYHVDIEFTLTIHMSMLGVLNYSFLRKGFCKSEDSTKTKYIYEKL